MLSLVRAAIFFFGIHLGVAGTDPDGVVADSDDVLGSTRC